MSVHDEIVGLHRKALRARTICLEVRSLHGHYPYAESPDEVDEQEVLGHLKRFREGMPGQPDFEGVSDAKELRRRVMDFVQKRLEFHTENADQHSPPAPPFIRQLNQLERELDGLLAGLKQLIEKTDDSAATG